MKHADFSSRFLQLCKEAGIPETQGAAGKVFGVSGTAIWKFRNGELLPSMDTALKMASILGVCVEYLLTGKGPKRPLESDPDRITVDITDLPEAQQEAVKTTVRAFKNSPRTPANSA